MVVAADEDTVLAEMQSEHKANSSDDVVMQTVATAGEDEQKQPTSSSEDATIDWCVDLREHRGENSIESPNFYCGKVPFNIRLFPRGSQTTDYPNYPTHFSVFLNLPSDEFHKHGRDWTVGVVASLEIVNVRDPSKSIRRQVRHNFKASISDQGFTHFFPLEKLGDGFCKDGTNEITLRACAKIVNVSGEREPDDFNSFNYDARSATGFVGLRNQGATCYMNSLLQTFYHISYLRKVVYLLPTEQIAEEDILSPDFASMGSRSAPDRKTDISLALQKLFYDLQTSKEAVSTKRLTRSFGWTSIEAFQQHDVQEFSRILCDVLEDKMDGTSVAGTIAELFEGKCETYTECTQIEFKSSRTETFHDLSLMVKGCSDVDSSLIAYCREELMTGANRYLAEGHGLQDARKGVRFKAFPPVLQLQLKRFEYNSARQIMVKVNDRFEFPKVLDLRSLISDSENQEHHELYVLQSVLVHSGSVYGGHYQVFIRPDCRGDWFRFDDDRVKRVSDEAAIDDNFGGIDDRYGAGCTRSSSAYMLVYIRKGLVDKYILPSDQTNPPTHLVDRFEREKQRKEDEAKRREDEKRKITLKIMSISLMKRHTGCELGDPKSIRVYRDKTLRENIDFFSEATGIPADRIQFLAYTRRQNSTMRPNRPFNTESFSKHVEDLSSTNKNSASTSPPTLYLLDSPSDSWTKLVDDANTGKPTLLIFKWLDPVARKVSIVGDHVFANETNFTEVMDHFRTIKNISDDWELCAQEEENVLPDSKGSVNAIDPAQTIAKHQLICGDIICFFRPPKHRRQGEDWKSQAGPSAKREPLARIELGAISGDVKMMEVDTPILAPDGEEDHTPVTVETFHDPMKPPIIRDPKEYYLKYVPSMNIVEFLPRNESDFETVSLSAKPPPEEEGLSRSPANLSTEEREVERCRTRLLAKKGKFSVKLSCHTQMQYLQAYLGQIFRIDPNRIRFYRSSTTQTASMNPCESKRTTEMETFALMYSGDAWRLHYEIMQFTWSQLRYNIVVDLVWRENVMKEPEKVQLLVPEEASVSDVLKICQRQFVQENRISESDAYRLRIVGTKASTFDSIIDVDCAAKIKLLPLQYMSKPPVNVIELTPLDEVDFSPADFSLHRLWVNFCEMKGYYRDGCSLPFSVITKKDDSLSDVKLRIKEKLQLSDSDFKKAKFSEFASSRTELPDDFVVFGKKDITLELADSKKRKQNSSSHSRWQQPLKIRK
eukprot:188358_1